MPALRGERVCGKLKADDPHPAEPEVKRRVRFLAAIVQATRLRGLLAADFGYAS
jgi:hypothetical protein